MAAAFDSFGTGNATGFGAGPRTVSYTHTFVGSSNRGMFVWVAIFQDVAGTGTVTAITYNGVTMTAVGSPITQGAMTGQWYWVAAPSGTATVSVTVTGATDGIVVDSVGLTGVAQSSPLGNTHSAVGGSGNPADSISAATSTSILLAALCRHANTAITATTWTNAGRNNATNTTTNVDYIVPADTASHTDTMTGSAAQDWVIGSVEVKVASAAAPNGAGFLSMLGV